MLNHEQEIAALKYARGEVSRGSMHVCNLVQDWASLCGMQWCEAENLVNEVAEFLDGKYTLERALYGEKVLSADAREGDAYCVHWHKANLKQTEVAKKYRLAIIDTLLAWRGVK